MGSSQGNYSQQIDTALTNANQPKSDLAKQMSQGLGNNFSSIFNSLGNAGGMGNAFPGIYGGASTPGSIQNQTVNFQQPQSNNQNQVFPNPNLVNGQVSNPNVQGNGSLFNSLDQNGMSPLSMQNIPGIGGMVFPNDPNGQRPTTPDGYNPQSQQNPNNFFGSGLPGISQANPALSNFNLSGMNPQALQALLQQYSGPQTSSYNPSAQLLSGNNGSQQLAQMLQMPLNQANAPVVQNPGFQQQLANPNLITAGFNPQNINPQQVNSNGVNIQQANLASTQQAYDPSTDPYYQAVQQSLMNQQNLDQKNLQAQFGASGGAGRGTPAAFAQAQLMAQQSPQMAAALGNVAQQEQANLLNTQNLVQSGNLQNAGMANQYGLANAQLNSSTQLANVQNQLQANNQNNQYGLGSAQLSSANQQANASNQMGAANLNNQTSLAARGQDISTQLANATNYLTANNQNNQNQLAQNQQLLQAFLGNQSNQTQLANQAGNQNLAQNQLGSQNYFNAAGLNSQNANLALQNQLGFQTNQNNTLTQNNNLLSQLSQFNSGQNNSMNQNYAQMMQTANQNQINNQFTGTQNIAQILAQFGLAGIPGGSAGVSLGGNSQSWLQQLGGLL